MADEDLRELERQAAQGDRHAQAQRVRARVRQGELPQNTFLLTPRERVDAWIRANGVDGVDVSEGRIDETRHAAMSKDIAGVIRLRWWLPYDRADQLRLVVENMTEMLEWVDPSRIAIQPVARLQHFEVVMILYLFDPLRMFKSRGCTDALAGDAPTHLHLGELADRAMTEAMNAMGEDERQRFQRGLQEFLFTGFSSEGPGEAERFEAGLSGELGHLVRDVRLVADLGRSHRGLIGCLDEWIHRERINASGAVIGKEWYLPVWTTYRSSYGVNDLPELRDERDEAPARPRAEDLYAKVADESLLDRERRDACSLLMDLPREEGGIFQIRALGWNYNEVLYRTVSFPELAPLFETLAMSRSNDRLDDTLRRLRDLGDAFEDPLEAWEPAGESRRSSFTSLHQDTILHNLPRSHPALVPLLVAELEQVAADMPTGAVGAAWQGLRRIAGVGDRPPEWIQAALQGLCNVAAREAAPVALRLTAHADDDVRSAALSFFRACDDPQAALVLQASLDDGSLDIVSAAEHGLSGQTSLSADALYAALQKLDARSAAPSEVDRFTAQQLGAQLLRILARLGVPKESERVDLIERVASRTSWLSDEARLFVALVAHEPKGLEESAGPTLGGTPLETFNLRYSAWRQPGYVRRRYGEAGHRDPAWDEWVEQAHAHYDSEQITLAGPVFQRALDAGCQDGMVLYRSAICVHQHTERIALLREAAARLPEQYPDSPYAVCAWEGIGNLLSSAGKDQEALEAYRLALGDVMCPPKVADALEKIEAKVGLRGVSADGLQPIATGSLKPWPSVWHLAPVTAVAVSPDGTRVASADEAGWVQVSRCDGDSIVPLRGAEVHSAGRVALAWRDSGALLSVGADGRMCVLDIECEPPNLGVTEALRHDSALTAIAALGEEGALLGDIAGAVLLAEGADLKPLGRAGQSDSPIRVLLTSERWWAAHDDAGHLEVWQAGGHSAYVARQPLTFVTFEEDGALAVGLGGGNGVRLELPSGRHLGVFSLPRAGQPLYVTHSAGLGSVFAWPRGPIQVTAGQGLTYLIQEPLTVVHARVDRQVGAYADGTNKLGMFRWRA